MIGGWFSRSAVSTATTMGSRKRQPQKKLKTYPPARKLTDRSTRLRILSFAFFEANYAHLGVRGRRLAKRAAGVTTSAAPTIVRMSQSPISELVDPPVPVGF
jgi:hypothetical protein